MFHIVWYNLSPLLKLVSKLKETNQIYELPQPQVPVEWQFISFQSMLFSLVQPFPFAFPVLSPLQYSIFSVISFPFSVFSFQFSAFPKRHSFYARIFHCTCLAKQSNANKLRGSAISYILEHTYICI